MWPFTRTSRCASCDDDYTSSYKVMSTRSDGKPCDPRMPGNCETYDDWYFGRRKFASIMRTSPYERGFPYNPEPESDDFGLLAEEGAFDGSDGLSEAERQGYLAWLMDNVVQSAAEQYAKNAIVMRADDECPACDLAASQTMVGAFFYDPDLAKFGNAVSPFVEMDAHDAHLAEQRRFEDRYDPRYFTTSNDTFVGWSQPPHPIDVVPSFDPLASASDQARAVLLDYYHDDALRYWSDNEAVKHCFIGGNDPRKENHDPALLVAAYENPNHQVWQCHGDKNTWKDLDVAVKQAIAHRAKLGPLPKSNYASDPVVVYYYDNDRMKKITYPRACLPGALNPNQTWWWKDDWIGCKGDTSDAGKKKGLDGVHTFESADPKAIAAERNNPGPGRVSEGSATGGGNWGSEGVTWDKDMIGVMGPIVGVLLSVISTILDMTGVGAVVGVPLQIATPFIVAAVNACDTALHAGDFGAALDNLGQMIVMAAGQALSKGANLNIPPEATKALAGTVHAIAETVKMNSRKQLDYGAMWNAVNAKAKSFQKIGDQEAHAIAIILGGDNNPAGKSFTAGYEAGRVADPDTIAAIAKIMTAMTQFADPRVINLFLLGAGIGSLSHAQDVAGLSAAASPKKAKKKSVRHSAHRAPAPHHTQGDFVGQSLAEHRSHLAWFVQQLAQRYGLGQSAHVAGPASDPMIVAIQTLLNELWGFVKGGVGYIAITGVLTPYTKEMTRSFQQSYNVPPGDGTPNLATVKALEAAVDDKRELQQHALHATSGSMFVMDARGTCHTVGVETEPDWGALSRGCPKGTWWDALSGQCRPIPPPPRVAGGQDSTVFFDFLSATDEERAAWQARNRAVTAHAYDDYVRRHGHAPTGGLIPSAEDEAALAWRKANGVDHFGQPLSSYTYEPDWSDMGDVMLGAPTGPEIVRWYAARTEGSARDLADSIASAPHVHLAGEYPTWTITIGGLARFKLVHDAEGGIRVHLLDVAPGRSFDDAWRQIETLIKSVGG